MLPPYVFGPGFEVYQPEGEDRRIVVLWLVPITSAEGRFVRLHGVQKFEELMERSEVNVVNPLRADRVLESRRVRDAQRLAEAAMGGPERVASGGVRQSCAPPRGMTRPSARTVRAPAAPRTPSPPRLVPVPQCRSSPAPAPPRPCERRKSALLDVRAARVELLHRQHHLARAAIAAGQAGSQLVELVAVEREQGGPTASNGLRQSSSTST